MLTGAAGSPSAKPTVLLVEDNEPLRWSTSELIQDLGYAVIEAYSAEEAMTLLQTRSIDVLVTDVGLPGISGDVFAAEARIMQPDLPIIIVTGNDRFSRIDEAGTSSVLLRKPYDIDDIAQALQRLSDSVGSRRPGQSAGGAAGS